MTIANVVGRQMATDGRQGMEAAKKVFVRPDPVVQDAAEARPSQEAARVAAEQIRRVQSMLGRKVHFNVNKDLNRVVIKVIDPTTDKVVREIPTREMQSLQMHIEQALGVFVDEQR